MSSIKQKQQHSNCAMDAQAWERQHLKQALCGVPKWRDTGKIEKAIAIQTYVRNGGPHQKAVNRVQVVNLPISYSKYDNRHIADQQICNRKVQNSSH